LYHSYNSMSMHISKHMSYVIDF